MFERLWLNRHCDDPTVVTTDVDEYERLRTEGIAVALIHPAAEQPDAIREAADQAYRLLEEYGEEALLDTDYDLGFLEGKLSALRWVLGMGWDELDT